MTEGQIVVFVQGGFRFPGKINFIVIMINRVKFVMCLGAFFLLMTVQLCCSLAASCFSSPELLDVSKVLDLCKLLWCWCEFFHRVEFF